MRDVRVSPRERALDYFRTTVFAFSQMPSANVWSHLNHIASEWIGEVKKFIAGIFKTSSICHSNAAAVFHLEGHLPRRTRALLVRLLTSLRGQRSC